MTDEAFALALLFLRGARAVIEKVKGNLKEVQEPMRHANIQHSEYLVSLAWAQHMIVRHLI